MDKVYKGGYICYDNKILAYVYCLILTALTNVIIFLFIIPQKLLNVNIKLKIFITIDEEVHFYLTVSEIGSKNSAH